jgi:pterin-4a-carbinolamine dehydratase
LPQVFISYRKSDALDLCRRMAAELRSYFGNDAVFFDETTALPGMEWPQELQDALRGAGVVLIVIGGQWLHAQDIDTGQRRIDIKDDWVRQEVCAALVPSGLKQSVVVPVLVGDTPMPAEDALGEDLRGLCHRQGIRVHDTGTPYDFRQLEDFLARQGFEPRMLPPVTTPRFGRVPEPLGDQEERDFLAKLELWEIVETPERLAPAGVRRELHRVYEFPTFDAAFQFMNEVVTRGVQPHNHHPRWENAFNRVEIWLTTFNLNYRPSKRDVRLARACESIWNEFLARSRSA